MAGEWINTTIGELIRKFGGSIKTGPFGTTLKAAEYSEHGVPLISVGEVGFGRITLHEKTPRVSTTVTERLPEYLLQQGDIVFGRKGAVERSARVTKEQNGWFLGSDGIRLRVPTTIDSKFVSYNFQTVRHRAWMLQNCTGTTMPSLNQGVIERIPITLPPLETQRAIAHILGTLDDKIELNRRTNQTLEAIAKALFKSWFVDFDPVRAKAEGRQPEGMDAETAALFPDGFGEDGLPRGWSEITISNVAKINSSTLRSPDMLEVIDYVEISAVNLGDVNEVVRYERGTEPSRARRRLAHGDTVLSTVRPERGAYFLSLWPSESLIASTGFAVVSPSEAPWSFVHSALTQESIFEELGRLADGGAYPAINPSVIGSWAINVPSDKRLLDMYHQTASALYEKAAQNRLESRTLAALRDSLLPKLLSGELSIPEVERGVKEVI